MDPHRSPPQPAAGAGDSSARALTLDAVEARVLGVLLEKEVTTPDAYPLSINATVAGCNQRSNREPVMTLAEGDVRDALERLVDKTLVREQGSAGGRTRRFAHRLSSRLFGTLEFSREERAVLCVLLLRGAQTPGEIRARCARLCEFPDREAVEQVLSGLAAREDGPHVAPLAREPGRREVRWRERFTTEPLSAPPRERGPGAAPSPRPAASPPLAGAAAGHGSEPAVDPLGTLARRLDQAERRIAALEAALARLDAPRAQAPGTGEGGA